MQNNTKMKSLSVRSRNKYVVFAVAIAVIVLLTVFLMIPNHHLPETVASLRERILTRREHQRAVASQHLKSIEKEIKEAHHLADVKFSNEVDEDHPVQLSEKETHSLETAFQHSDSNNDNQLSLDELTRRIHENAIEHLDAAIVAAGKEFAEVDALGVKNDFVDWQELLQWEKQRRKHAAQDYSKEDEEEMKELFHSADENEDAKLSAREFMCYMHPELCESTIDEFAQDTMHGLDTNNDKRITLQEYTALPPGELVQSPEAQAREHKWQEQQSAEFHNIDADKNNFIDMNEFRAFLNPRNVLHAKNEATELLTLADTNGDGKIDMNEMKKNAHMFLGSKVIDAGESFHQEF